MAVLKTTETTMYMYRYMDGGVQARQELYK